MATSIRAQLTATYATALVVTLAAFGGVLLAARRSAQERELSERVGAEADLALRIVRQAAEAGDPVTAVSDPRIGPVVTPKLRTLLEGVPDYVLVLDSAGRTLYNSFAVRQLDDDDQVTLSRAAIVLPPSETPRPIDLKGRRLLIVAAIDPGHVGSVARIVAGVGLDQSTVAAHDIGGVVLLAAPLILLVSVGAAYMIAGRAFRPVDVIINEVEAITDGRSLHRRLAVDGAGDELTRLNSTLNAMIAR